MPTKHGYDPDRVDRLVAFLLVLAARANTMTDGGYLQLEVEHDRIVQDAIRQTSDLDFGHRQDMTFDRSSEKDLPWVE